MKKSEIANRMEITTDEIHLWAQMFKDWLDICAHRREKDHDEDDVAIFTLINFVNNKLDKNTPFPQRRAHIERQLLLDKRANSIKHKRMSEKNTPTPNIARWGIIRDECLEYEYEWLKPLRLEINNIATFGCWASDIWTTCSEPYALLWTLEASRIVVVDKEPEYIQNATMWLESTRKTKTTTYFNDYDLKFVLGDMSDKDLLQKVRDLKENAFDVSYCCRVLYYMDSDAPALNMSIENMARVVRPKGWIIAVEPIDVSTHFEAIGLRKFILRDAPDNAYCYQKL